MAEFPALPLWTDSYLADCSHLSDAEHGRYFQLLMAMWRSPDCRLPNDDHWFARRFRRSVEDIRDQFRPLIKEFCQCTGNWIMQKRLAREYAYVRARTKKRSDAAKSRWNKEKGACDASASSVHKMSDAAKSLGNNKNGMNNADAPTPTPTPFKKIPPTEAADAAPPDPKKPLYDLGKSILGPKSGGVVTNLLRHHGGHISATMRTLHLAATKTDAREYIGAVLRGDAAARTEAVLDQTDRLYRDLGVSA